MSADTTDQLDDIVDGEVVEPSRGLAITEPSMNDVSQAIQHLTVDDEWAGVADGDLAPQEKAGTIPILRMNRNTAAGQVPGFTIPHTGEVTPEVQVALLARQVNRAWFAKPYDPKAPATQPDCSSSDGVVPSDRSPMKQAEACASCRHHDWVGDTPPACKKSMVAMVLHIDEDGTGGSFNRIRFGGLAYGPFVAYWDSFANRVPVRPPMSCLTTIGLADTKGDGFLRPVFTRGPELARAALNPIISERDARMGEFKALSRGDAVEQAEVEDANVNPFGAAGTVVYSDAEEPF